jgi:hypothetical protein
MIGALLQNRYLLDAELGCGSMGMVYHTYDTLLDRPVTQMIFATRLKAPCLFVNSSDQHNCTLKFISIACKHIRRDHHVGHASGNLGGEEGKIRDYIRS